MTKVKTPELVRVHIAIPDTVSVAEFCRLTGRRPESVRRSLRRGQLQGGKVGRDWVVARPPEAET